MTFKIVIVKVNKLIIHYNFLLDLVESVKNLFKMKKKIYNNIYKLKKKRTIHCRSIIVLHNHPITTHHL